MTSREKSNISCHPGKSAARQGIVQDLQAGQYFPRLKGFTLMEMLIALALTSTVLSLGFFTFRTFLQFQLRYESKVDATYDTALIHHQLQQDLRRSVYLQQQAEHILLFDPDQVLLIRYQDEDSMLLRHQHTQTDTLFGQGSLSLYPNRLGLIWTDPLTGENHFPLPKHAEP